MPELTPSERRALSLAAVLLALGTLARLGLGPGPERWSWHPVADSTGGGTLDSVRAAVDRELARARRTARPLAPDEQLDPNRADVVELQRLSGVGPATARALVRSRREEGEFRHLGELLRVPGIGPRTAARIAPHLSLPPPPRTSRPVLDLNRATEGQLRALPGIGPALAGAIVRSRREEGAYRRVDELLRVSGIGPARLERLRDRVRVGPPQASGARPGRSHK